LQLPAAARLDRVISPREPYPYMEGHNTWCANLPGSLLAVPVADLAQHMLLILCFIVQNGYCLFDDVSGRQVPGIEQFGGLVDLDAPYPLTFLEQNALTEATAELATSCYAGVLTLQAMGLGGWMFDGIDRFTMLGASGDPDVPGLGFRYDSDERWAVPNPTGLPGVLEAFCPPHYPDMAAATDAVVELCASGIPAPVCAAPDPSSTRGKPSQWRVSPRRPPSLAPIDSSWTATSRPASRPAAARPRTRSRACRTRDTPTEPR
jgi:hypothetical protein